MFGRRLRTRFNSKRKPQNAAHSKASHELLNAAANRVEMEQEEALREYLERFASMESSAFFTTNMEFAVSNFVFKAYAICCLNLEIAFCTRKSPFA